MSDNAQPITDPPGTPTGPELPSIQVTNDFSTASLADASPHGGVHASTPDSPYSPTHARSPSDPLYLTPSPFSPHAAGARSSLDVPSTPALSLNTSDAHSSDGSSMPPPSPTSSTRSSFQAVSSLALRENKPDEKHGLSSLNLLKPGQQHGRKGSVSSYEGSTDGTEPDSHTIAMTPLSPKPSTLVNHSPTATQFDAASSVGGTTIRSPSPALPHGKEGRASEGPSGESAGDDQPEQRPILDVAQDEHIDPGPFTHKPYFLASLVDPKNFEDLRKAGGVRNLLRGLGTSSKRGLSKKSLTASEPSHDSQTPQHHHDKDTPGDGRPGTGGTKLGAGDGVSHRHQPEPEGGGEPASPVPNITLTSPTGEDDRLEDAEEGRSDDETPEGEGGAYDAPLAERHRVYGENVLPSRKSKSLLQLMWLALKDKVLVCFRIYPLSLRFR